MLTPNIFQLNIPSCYNCYIYPKQGGLPCKSEMQTPLYIIKYKQPQNNTSFLIAIKILL